MVWVDPENGVGFEITVFPVDVLQVFSGDDGDFEV